MMPTPNNANTGDSTGLVITARFNGRNVGPIFRVQLAYPSKTGLIKWMFGLLKLIKNEGSPVANSSTMFVPGSALTLAGSSPASVALPLHLLNKRPFSFAGKTPGNGSSSGSVSQVQRCEYQRPDGAVKTDSGLLTYVGNRYVASWTDDRVGVLLPKWRSLIEAGGNATTPMTAHRGTMAGMPGHMMVRFKRSYDVTEQYAAASGVFQNATPQSFTAAGLATLVDGKALSKLHDKLYNLQHDAKVGESLGEFKQSLAMIGKPLTGLQSLVALYRKRQSQAVADAKSRWGKNLNRFDFAQAQQLQRSLASIYLEFNFGWLPLAKDLLAAISAAQTARGNIATKVTASFVDERVTSDTTVSDLHYSYCYVTNHWVKKHKCSVRYQIGINPLKVDALSYAERLGLTPGQFVPTLYALLPYSWLFDYFTGINASIDALCADLSFTTWKCKTVRDVASVEITSTPDISKAKSNTNGFISAVGSPSVSRSTMTTVVRSVPSNLVPVPIISIPKTWKPWLNIAALFVQKKIAPGGTSLAVTLANLPPNSQSIH